ncbi:delta-60 repeat domain-containing protein (plasmid) [Hymenobacter sp. 5317J-9]|uniref:delta-60 repeat domain-containing protein n=1 Tax=Hymenobacter sp. 5317J-9 TaxID=2932250 RepID=UPI001FD687D2|nr:delta-60 repeat domain-containing protein [Hymenobacter sp. 5317J-9]UOR00198.1 delta-60 repeat domain-containing protein [Hymenobacter sp. 5317J-9]
MRFSTFCAAPAAWLGGLLTLLALLLPGAARSQAPIVTVTPAGPLTLCPGSTLTLTATIPGFNGAGSGANSIVRAVVVQPDGKVLVGGDFTAYNGAASPRGVLRLNPDGSLDNTFNPGGAGVDGAVYALALQPDGKVLVGGFFVSYNGASSPDYLLRLNANGSLDTSFNPGGAGASSAVYALAVQPDGSVLVGGGFTAYNTNPAAPDYVMRLRSTGLLDTSFNPVGAGGTNGVVNALALQPDGKVLVGACLTTTTAASSPTT